MHDSISNCVNKHTKRNFLQGEKDNLFFRKLGDQSESKIKVPDFKRGYLNLVCFVAFNFCNKLFT